MPIQSDTDLIKYHEGCTLVAIRDTHGWSIGYGHDGAYEGQTCTQAQADAWFVSDHALARQRAATDLGEAWASLDPVRQACLVDMAYEMGGRGLADFKEMISKIYQNDYAQAAFDGANSIWMTQVPKRAAMDMIILATGIWPEV